MVKLNHALIATDLSEYSLGIRTCVDLYLHLGVEHAHLLHVTDPHGHSEAEAAGMNAFAQSLREAGLRVEVSIEEDEDAAVAILRKGIDLQPDLLILGSHGKGILKRLLLGSVSQKVLHHWHGSILIERLPFEEVDGGLQKVCRQRLTTAVLAGRRHYPTDPAYAVVKRLATNTLQQVVLFTALEISDFVKVYVLDQIPQMEARAREELEHAAAPLLSAGLEVDLRVEPGAPVTALVHAAEDVEAGLVVMQLHTQDPWEELIERIVARLPCSALVLRSAEEA
jgi:nucleotide-binding universal stress UspA family protein